MTFVQKWQQTGIRNRFIFYVFDKVIFEKNKYFNQHSVLGKAARTMLLQWESEDPKVRALWQQMNQWVYDGFETTYRNLGVTFDKLYYESNTYLLGKETIEKGLAQNVFYQKDDQSVWIDLTAAKLDHKIVLRSDGTSVYITQDIGTAQLRYNDFGTNRMVYVVADEQNYHFQVLFETMKRLGEPYADGLYHLSYGMVDLPTGKMKSREGTVVDADDLMAEVINEARKNAEERGEIIELTPAAREAIIQKIGMAALKFFIIKVQPKKRMIFDPKESVDMQGQTGPYVQNAYVRIQSILRKAGELSEQITDYTKLQAAEKEMINKLYAYPNSIAIAAQNYDPSEIANYCYDLAKSFHKFYHDFSILRAENEGAKQFRLLLSKATANVLSSGMKLLGIEMPDRM
ncbi:MAG: arginine--tRNA ligase [Saprospiraceae bacterium]|nr:arginine--tRNA ligase [Saprospiraceae bacterium]